MAPPHHRQHVQHQHPHQPEDAPSFGAWLRQRRRALDLTQAELAQRVGCARITIRRIEADDLKPSRELAQLLADHLGISVAQQDAWLRAARGVFGQPLTSQTICPSAPLPPTTDPLVDVEVLHEAQYRLPLERPPRPQYFIGRQTELVQLLAALQPGRVITLCGPGGIGKTALAAEAVWQLAPSNTPPDRFPDGILFYCFYNQPHVALAFEHIARNLGKEPKPTPREAAQLLLASRRLLLILDGAEEADDLNQLLDIRNECAVLVTSRNRKDAVAERQDILPLSPDEAVLLIQAWGGKRASDKIIVGRISELVGGLPLALRLVGRFLAENEEDAADYLLWLTKTPLAALDQGQRHEESVSKLLARSIAQVSGDARLAMGVIGLLALAPFTYELIAAALQLSDLNTRLALGELVRYGLLLRPSQVYEVTHALIHTYARVQLLPPAEVIERLAVYYIMIVRNHQSDFPLLNNIRPHIMAILSISREQKAWLVINELVSVIANYLDLQGYWNDRITAIEAGLDAIGALQKKEHTVEWLKKLRWMYRELGWTYGALGQAKKAFEYSQQALTIAKQLGDRVGEIDSLATLGITHAELGQMEQAIENFQYALVVSREVGDRRGEGNQLGNLGNVYYFLGQTEQAIEFYQQALTIAKEIGNRRGESNQLGNLGLVYITLEQVEQAIKCSEQALTIAKEIGDRRGEGAHIGALGLAYAALGKVEQAISYHQQALSIAKEIGDRRDEIEQLKNLGLANAAVERIDLATKFYQQALINAKEIGDRRLVMINLHKLGQGYRKLNQLEQANLCFEQALRISRELGFQMIEEEVLRDMGTH